MSLGAGTRLGPYEILEAIGEGGMGEVFKARDTRLDRHVAIKILPPHWADDADMKERFAREAQAIASLNHPNICALHDIGSEVPQLALGSGRSALDGDVPAPSAESPAPVAFLVMELLDGETLAARLARGALSLDDALDIAVPIADALDQAHRRGVVHRDLKPGNVMLTPGGPKLLDFGLAKTPAAPKGKAGSSPPGSGPAQAGPSGSSMVTSAGPVPTLPLTTPGLLIGTLQYMAPEQLEGLEADARTDIFAFGVMLHEMITGKRAFEGKSQVLLISSIATSEPAPPSTVQPQTPPALDHVVKTCLAKSPDDRWQTARDLLAELRWIADGGAAATAIMPTGGRPARRATYARYALAAIAVLVAALAVPAYSYFQGPVERGETRYRLWTSPSDDTPHQDGYFAISPDGRNIVYRGDEDAAADPNGLYVGRIGATTYRRLPGTDEPTQPFWSPDSRHIAFIASGRLQRIEASGGPPQVIATVGSFMGGDWNAEGTIIFGTSSGIYRVSAEGGTPQPVTELGDGEAGHYWPHFLPDGRRFLYLAWATEVSARAVFAGSLDSAERTRVMTAESNAAYTSAGHLLFHREGAVYAQPFDADALALSGEPTRVADGILFNNAHGLGLFAVARDGTLAYSQPDASFAAGGGPETWLWQPAWIDRSGREIAKVGPYMVYRGAEVSPDGRRIALHRHDDAGGDVWIVQPTGSDTRLTYSPENDNSMPIWSPDGQHVVFNSQRNGKWGLYRKLSDGRGTEELLYESDVLVVPMSWSPDGLRIVFGSVQPQTGGDLWVLSLEAPGGAVSGEPEVYFSTPANETHGQISPDGRWLAYASNETRAEQYRDLRASVSRGRGSLAGVEDGRRLASVEPRRQGALLHVQRPGGTGVAARDHERGEGRREGRHVRVRAARRRRPVPLHQRGAPGGRLPHLRRRA